MKKTRKIFLIITAVLALAICFAFGASAEEFTDGYYTYTVENGEATITAVDTSISGDVIIPNTLGGYPVVAIGRYAFYDCHCLTSIVIPDSVTNIGLGAFTCCYNLKDIIFGKNLTTIDTGAFGSCISLTNIKLPEKLESIGEQAFVECMSIKEISIPQSIKVIGVEAFEDCINLSKIEVYNKETVMSESVIGFGYIVVNEEKISKAEFAEKICEAYQLCLDVDLENRIERAEEQANAIIEEYAYFSDTDIKNEDATIHGYIGSTAETYAKENGIKFEEIKDDVNITDEDTKVQVEYESTVFDGEPTLLISESIVDANYVFVSLFSKFAPYDISFEMNGEKVQPNGKVTVKIPLPENYNADTTFVYYVDDSGNYTKLDSTYADGYIIFETDHFSEYVLVDESSKIEQPSTEPDEPSTEPDDEPATEPEAPADDDCGCACHNNGFMKFIYKIINFFRNIFGKGNCCECF